MSQVSPREQLGQMILGIVPAQAIFVAAKLKIADHLSEGLRTPAELAHETGAHAESLHRLLRMLAGIGLFAEDDAGRFGLSPMSELLRSDAPEHMRDVALMFGGEQGRAWVELEHSVMTGGTAFQHVFGMPLFDYLGRHPESARIFDGAMTGVHGPETPAMIEAYDFNAFETIVDIGGGNASALLRILQACPRPHGIVFDLPHVAEHAADLIAASPLAGRCRTKGGDFFSGVPHGADCYVMRHIIHDWDDERSITILRNCREAMRPGGKVLVVESVLPSDGAPHFGKTLDLIMLAIPGGRERTAEQYRTLFDVAGLRLSRIVPTGSPVSIIEGAAA